jgi:hypothetical protein
MTVRKLNTWVEIAQLISAAAVVLSLAYVGLQIHQSTLESDADIQAELLSYTVQRRYLVVESSDLSPLLVKGYADPTLLSPDERRRFQSYLEIFYVAWERAYMTRIAGVFSQELFDGWNRWFVSVAQHDPAFVWPMVRDSQSWDPGFIHHVNESLGDSMSGTEAE